VLPPAPVLASAIFLDATINPSQEVPPTNLFSNASGFAEVDIDQGTVAPDGQRSL
jgi:hypothetical protein